MALVLDSGGVSRLAERSRAAAALIIALRARGLWPPIVPSAVLIECLTGDGSRDAASNRLLAGCDLREVISLRMARRCASLRRQAHRGSAVDALVVATAEPGGTVLTGDPKDLSSLAQHARNVTIQLI